MPDATTLAGVNVQKVLLSVRTIAPLNPLRGATMIVDVTVDPALPVTLGGLEETVKSSTA